jgi:beta-galactosidase
VEVIDYSALLPEGTGTPCGGQENVVFSGEGEEHLVGSGIWRDALEVHGATVLARYRGEPYDGMPAITLHHAGAGHVFYLGTAPDAAGQLLLVDQLLRVAQVKPGPEVPLDVEVVRRVHEGVDHWFILNHAAIPQEIALPAAGTDLLTGRTLRGTVRIDGRDAVVVRADRA